MKKIIIEAGGAQLAAYFNESPTARLIWEALPIEGHANVWGEEIYFDIPVAADPEPDARAEVEVGELGYWPVGRAFCIFFGPTPVSTDEKPRAASPVNILGMVESEVAPLLSVKDGDAVRILSGE